MRRVKRYSLLPNLMLVHQLQRQLTQASAALECFHSSSSAAASSRPQPQVSDRHQIGDADAGGALTNTASISSGRGTTGGPSMAPPATPSTAPGTSATDDLGPLPPGWQLSKTENDRLFFIDHINKRTTWVCDRGVRRERRLSSVHVYRSIHARANPVHCQLLNVN